MRRGVVLHAGNTRRRDAATPRATSHVRNAVALALAAALLTLCSPTTAAANALPSDRPSPEQTLAAYRQVESWVRAWQPPNADAAADDADATDAFPDGVVGAMVALRFNGRVVGRGAVIDDAIAPAEALALATVEAMRAAAASTPAGVRAEEVSERLAIDVQLAYDLRPLLGRTFAAVGAQVDPGRQGVAARSGESYGAVYPATMLTTGLTPERAVGVAATRAGLPPLELDQLRSEHNVRVYLFDVTHIAQPRAGAGPTFLTRGGRTQQTAGVTLAGVATAADRAAAHLLARRWPGDEAIAFMGDYLPASGQFEPLVAPPLEQALATLALARYAGSPGISASLGASAADAAWRALDSLRTAAPGETDTLADPIAAGAWLAAYAELRASPSPEPPIGLSSERLDAFAARAVDLALAAVDAERPLLPAPGRAIIALGLARAAAFQDDRADALTLAARTHVRRLFREAGPGSIVALMPWLLLAELAARDEADDVPSAEALDQLRELVGRHTITRTDAGPEAADLVGGIVFTRGRTPLPTWQSLKPIATLAIMLRDPRLTPADDRPRAFAELIPLLRFTMQLQADDAAGHMYANPDRAAGGFRAALWDQTMPLDTHALGLLALTEALRAAE
jgi:hypothetical protein